MPLTGELARIDDELRRAYDGDCWHGPPLRATLKGVTATAAATRHPPLVHSVWAMVNHLAAWVEVVAMPHHRTPSGRRARRRGLPARDRHVRGGVDGGAR